MPTAELLQETTSTAKKQLPTCYHCGLDCHTKQISLEEKYFCCEGCKLVYEILNEKGLCDYYKIESHPGLSQIKPLRKDKYAYLDNEEIAERLYRFSDGKHTIVNFYLPGVHCTSCMWLLEHLYKINPAISESRLDYSAKEVSIHFDRQQLSVRKLVELLATIGYEPYISLDDVSEKKLTQGNKQRLLKLGIAGFCFGNIMMLSFPEYLAIKGIEHQYVQLFRYLNLLLALPVFFYSATEFFTSAWKGIQQKMLNIDAPIVLSLLITFTRSIIEIVTNTGGGYLDSMSGIVFFMLVGRLVQDRAYQSISFHRDYKSYFPVAVTVVTEKGIESRSLDELKENDIVQLHNDEIIPADALILQGEGAIDYSFVTGESKTVRVAKGERVYAGGKQLGEQLVIRLEKPVAGSYLTSLWNHFAFSKNKAKENNDKSIVHKLSKYFTLVLLLLATLTAIYWSLHDSSKIWVSVSAMLIVACPCALLIAVNYTNGNLLRLLSQHGLFIRDTSVIEQFGNVNHICFDKTGTLTQNNSEQVQYATALSDSEKDILYTVAASSKHPYSKAIAASLTQRHKVPLQSWKEIPGQGVEADYNGQVVKIGAASFVEFQAASNPYQTFVRMGEKIIGVNIAPAIRKGTQAMMTALASRYQLSLVSGDTQQQEATFRNIFPENSDLLFQQQPIDKLKYVEQLQQKGKNVLMIGDGLNDAGALQQSNVGITIADDINNFIPSCDAILAADKYEQLPGLLKLARSGKIIIGVSFAVSVIYNIVGLSFAVQGKMNPLIAAILMPASTLTTVLITTGLSTLYTRVFGLK